ncbi:MAG: hypothetical protein WD469_07110 [Paenibacillaceae bacterium]
MKKKWKQSLILLILTASLLIPSVSFQANADEMHSISSVQNDYRLTSSIIAKVKSILNEQIPNGTRVAAVVRLYNEGVRVIRVPDYEVRVKTKEGIEYTLRPSVVNAKAIQPKVTIELSYMIVVAREDAFSLSTLSWVDVDEYVYPKLEKPVLSIPIASIEWKGGNAVLSDPTANIKWGEVFAIPVLSSAIEYKAVSLDEQNTPQGPVAIIGLLATNMSEMKRSLPDLRIDGTSDMKVYNGKRLELVNLVLDSGEQRYLHYAIPLGNGTKLKGLTILSPEDFALDDQTNVNYTIGRLHITLPDDSNAMRFMAPLLPYEWNKPIQFDSIYKWSQPEIDVSMVTLRMHESAGGGIKTAVAKFKLQNHSDHPLPVPHFQAQLRSTGGYQFTGTRQTTGVETLIPNISYVIYYSFVLPSTESGEQLVMEIMDGETFAPYNIPIAAIRTQVQLEQGDTALAFYPFKVRLNNWSVGMNSGTSVGNLPYAYNLRMDLDITPQSDVVADQSFSKIKVELVDAQGKTIGVKALLFTGENRLVSGMQTININSERFGSPLSLRIYETMDTPFGEADRLIQILKP